MLHNQLLDHRLNQHIRRVALVGLLSFTVIGSTCGIAGISHALDSQSGGGIPGNRSGGGARLVPSQLPSQVFMP